MNMIASMRREIAELKGALDRTERERDRGALHERVDLRSGVRESSGNLARAGRSGEEAVVRMAYELEVCRRDLEEAKQALHRALEDRKALEIELREKAARSAEGEAGKSESPRSHPHLDWVGRHFLAVSLPEDRMFRPGESVTPVGVLQKLFEMRMGERRSAGFSILLENVNIALSQKEPEWYAKHFGFTRPRVYANGYRCTDKVDTEDFAWLLFEYGAQAPFVELLAGLLTVLNSTGKGGVTAVAVKLSQILYSSSVTLFRETVARASESFLCVRGRAAQARESLGAVTVPVDAGLPEEHSDRHRGSNRARNGVLRSVLEGIESPRFASFSPKQREEDGSLGARDSLNIDRSLSAFIKRRQRDPGELSGGNGGSRTSRFDRAEQLRVAAPHRPERSSLLAKRVQIEPFL
uniref:Uncharacterized protein n=1 Tax=Oryzias latipes TaxID=8090 RepID=A0A286P9V7_ORYLA|nr:hypothetical protein [Oryzias latipes]